MSVTYGFFNSISGDRKYSAKEFGAIFDGILNDGVFASVGAAFAVSAGDGMQVIVAPGRAWFNSTWTLSDADYPLAIGTADASLTRYDAVVIEVNENDSVRENSIKIVQGTPASSPVKPTLTYADGVYQHALAYVTVPGGATEITAANIENIVGLSQTPYVTGILSVVSVDALFSQWQADFEAWFANLQAQMEGDVATNLQNQIDANKTAIEEVKITDTMAVGDILASTRVLDDDRFLYCDGSHFSEFEYPELCNNITKDIQTKYTIDSTSSNINGVRAVAYANGYYVAAGSFDTSNPSIAFATSVFGPWTIAAVTTDSSSSEYNYTSDIIYNDGLWICCGTKYTGTYCGFIAYTDDIENGTWTFSTVLSGSSLRHELTSIIYANGYYVCSGKRMTTKVYSGATKYISYGIAAYATALTGEWNIKDLWSYEIYSDSSMYVNASVVKYINNMYMICGGVYKQSACVATADTPNGTWTVHNLWPLASDTEPHLIHDICVYNGIVAALGKDYVGNIIVWYTTDVSSGNWTRSKVLDYSARGVTTNRIKYLHGYWIVVGSYYKDTSSSTLKNFIAYTKDLTTKWTVTSILDSHYKEICSIEYANGYWACCGAYTGTSSSDIDGAFIAYAASLDGEWASKIVWSDYSYNVSRRTIAHDIVYANGYWVVCGDKCTSNVYYNAHMAYATSLSGVWTAKTVVTTSSTGSSYAYRARYVIYNGSYWIIGVSSGSNIGISSVYYASDPSSTWTVKTLSASNVESTCVGLYTHTASSTTTTYAVFGTNYSYNNYSNAKGYIRIYSSTSIGTWTSTTISVTDVTSGLAFANGGFAVDDNYYYLGVTLVSGNGVIYAKALSNSFSVSLCNSSFGYTSNNSYAIPTCNDVIYANGKYVFCGSVSYRPILAYGETISGELTTFYVDQGTEGARVTDIYGFSSILYDGEYFVVTCAASDPQVYLFQDLDSDPIEQVIDSGSSMFVAYFVSLVDGLYIVGAYLNNNYSTTSSIPIYLSSVREFSYVTKLPLLSEDLVYYYIKAQS